MAAFALVAGFAASIADTPYDACFSEAGERYRIAPALLEAIARTESGLNPHARNTNRNGSADVGLMQINSRWHPQLAELGIDADSLWDPCLSIHIGAWVLAQNIQRYGDTWTAVGAYNAGTGRDAATEHRRRAYAARVSGHLSRHRASAHDVRVRREASDAAARGSRARVDRGHLRRDRAATRARTVSTAPLVRHLQPVSRADHEDAGRQRE